MASASPPNKCEATPVNWAVQIGPYGALLSMQRDAVLAVERRGRAEKREDKRKGVRNESFSLQEY